MKEFIDSSPIFICAGEPSGDMYASLLINRLKKKNPKLRIYGVGSEEMRRSGADVVEDCNRLMTLGFSAGLFHSLRNYQIYRKIARIVYMKKPKIFIPVAYPGINLLLCRYAKRLGCRVYYFLPPQIWAWGFFRKYFIKKWVDKVISVFPFEYEFLKKNGIRADYLENPLFDELKKYKRNDFKRRIGFMPGSRDRMIKQNLPIVLEAIASICEKKTVIAFDVILHSRNEWLLGKIRHLRHLGCNRIQIITKNRYQAMKNCDLLIISSGTASLEAAIMRVPQIFFNRPSFLDYYFFRHFIKIKEYNLANLYFNKQIVPNFVFYNKNHLLQNLCRLVNDYIS